MSLNVSALRESFELIAPRADQLAERFYFRLFERAPRLKPLFASTDFADQRRQLVQALIVIVRSLEQPETLQKYLRELGNRHAASGVVADDYTPFADTLLALLAEFTGEAWTAEFQSAWSDALEFIASVMSQAAPEEVVCDNETRPAHAAAASRAAVSRLNVARNGIVSRDAVAAADPAALTAPATSGHHGRMEKAATPVSAMPPTSSNGSDEQAFDRFFGMVEHAPLAQFFVQPDGTVAYLNRKGQEVVRRLSASLEFGPQEFVGGSIEQLYRVQPALRSAAQNLRAERRLRIAVGEEWLDVSLVPVQDGEGRRLGVVQSWSVATDQIRLSDEFRSLAQLMSGSARQVRGDVDGMTDAAEQAVRRSRDAVAAGESAAKNVEAGLSATEELSVSIAEVARLVQNAVTMTRQAVQDADRTRCTIAELDESSREIGRIVKVVTSIAQQTNLLALNATIEAARAGDAGKGFAVVANEVKELARQTARAIEGIHKQAGAIQLSVDTADDALGALCASIGKINQLSTTVAGAVEEQAVATGRISRNAVQAVTKTAEATGNIADILQAAAECGKSTAEILASANTLIDASAQLDRLTIDSKRSLSYEENSPGR